MINDIRKGVISKLKDIFGIDIYGSDVVLKSDIPFFRVKVLGYKRYSMLGNRFRLKADFEVILFDDRDKIDIFEADDIISRNMKEISVLGRNVYGNDISMDMVDNKRKYTLSYTVICEEREEVEVMGHMVMKESVKVGI